MEKLRENERDILQTQRNILKEKEVELKELCDTIKEKLSEDSSVTSNELEKLVLKEENDSVSKDELESYKLKQLDKLYVDIDKIHDEVDVDAQITTKVCEKEYDADYEVESKKNEENRVKEIVNIINKINTDEMVGDDEIIVSDYFEHLNSVGLTYTEHMFHSLKYSACMALGSITAFIHAFYPDVFVTSTSSTVDYLQNEMKARKHSQELQKKIRRQLKKIKRN
jgi:hypothetical protein